MPESQGARLELDDDGPLDAANPINGDRYNLFGFGMQLAKIIEAYARRATENEAPIIGVTGPWGCGKTSVVRIAHFLMTNRAAREQEYKDLGTLGFRSKSIKDSVEEWQRERPLKPTPGQTPFQGRTGSPWVFRFVESWSAGETDLAFDLFDHVWSVANEGLEGGLKTRIERWHRWFSRRPARLGQLLSLGAGAVALLGQGDGGGFETHGQGDPDQELDKLRERLVQRGIQLVLVIDDIDRLTPDRAATMISALWWVRKIRNAVIVLVYDQARLTGALAQAMFGADGQAEATRFLEKIVQVTVDLPTIASELLLDTFRSRVLLTLGLDIETGRGTEFRGRSRWREIEQIVLAPVLTTPRAVTRLVNAVGASRLMIPDDMVDIRDHIAVQALRLFSPQRYLAVQTFAQQIEAGRQDSEAEVDDAVKLLFPSRFLDVDGEPLESARSIMERKGLDQAGMYDILLRHLPPRDASMRFEIQSLLAGETVATARIAELLKEASDPRRLAYQLFGAIASEIPTNDDRKNGYFAATQSALDRIAELVTDEKLRVQLQNEAEAYRKRNGKVP